MIMYKLILIRIYSCLIGLLPESRFKTNLRLRLWDYAKPLYSKYRAQHLVFSQYSYEAEAYCPLCLWHGVGTGKEYYQWMFDTSCPNCGLMLEAVQYS